MAQALARWWHPVASNVAHRVMRIASYRCIAMAITAAINLPVLFVIVDFVVAHNCMHIPRYGP
jgi:hypothetical protein